MAALSGQFQQRALAGGGIRPVFTQLEQYGQFNGGQYVFRKDLIAKNPEAVTAFTTGVGKAIEWQKTTPREEVIARFTDIVNARKRTNENPDVLKYWLSVGVPSKFGEISDKDFANWQDWLKDTGAVTGDLDLSNLYTNEFNKAATGSAEAPAAKAGG